MNANDIATLTYIESMTTEAVLTTGAILSRAREAAGFSQQDVAERLNLLPAVVRALEADNFSAVRSPVFCRGYLISYAKLLGLSVADVLVSFETYAGSVQPVVAKPVEKFTFKPVAIRSGFFARKHYGAAILAIAATIVVAVTLFVANNTSTKLKIDTPVNSIARTDDAAVVQSGVSTSVQTATQSTASLAATSTAINLPGVNALKIADTTGKEVDTASAPVKVEVPVSKVGEDQLSLRFTDKCWIEIRDSNNVVIASGVYRANEKLNLSGKGPFKLLLGFAPGVNVALNGQAIDVGPGDAVNHTARLVVGSS